MKRLFLLFVLFIFNIPLIFSQSPLQFKYQAVLRNADGTIMADENVSIVISILKSDLTTSVFTETHNTSTNSQGLVNLNIGSIENLKVIFYLLGA